MPYENVHPLVFFWIAFYKDGTCLPQFDVNTGKENLFKDIDQSKLEKFGLFPFNTSLALSANVMAGQVVAKEVENLPYFILKLKEEQRLISVRRNKIHMFNYQHCNKCGFDWQWMGVNKEGLVGEVGLEMYSNHLFEEQNGKKYPVPVCPKCGAYNAIICPDCHAIVNQLRRKDSDDLYFECSKCKKEYPRWIQVYEDILRTITYVLGYQTTVEGKNIKQVQLIKEDGTYEMSLEIEDKKQEEKKIESKDDNGQQT